MPAGSWDPVTSSRKRAVEEFKLHSVGDGWPSEVLRKIAWMAVWTVGWRVGRRQGCCQEQLASVAAVQVRGG